MEELRRKILLQGEDTNGLGTSKFGLFASIRNNKSSDNYSEEKEKENGNSNADVSTHSASSGRSGSASILSNTELSGHGAGSGFVSGLGPGSSADSKYGGHSTDKLRFGTKKSSSSDNDINNNNSSSIINGNAKNNNNSNNNNNNNTHQHSHSHTTSTSSSSNGGHNRDRERERDRDRDIRGKLIKSGDALHSSKCWTLLPITLHWFLIDPPSLTWKSKNVPNMNICTHLYPFSFSSIAILVAPVSYQGRKRQNGGLN